MNQESQEQKSPSPNNDGRMKLKDVGYKSYADSTLRMMKKDELIEIIRALEHNWLGAEERCEKQYVILDWCINKGVLAKNLQEINTALLEINGKGKLPHGYADKEFKRLSNYMIQEYNTMKLFKRIAKEIISADDVEEKMEV